MLDLVDYFGVENVYVSVYESGSWDDSKGALRALDNDLEKKGVQRTVTLNDTTHADELKQPATDGWIQTPRGKKELRRIPYLSKLRNLALEPLDQFGDRTKFDKVLFLNDVVFTVGVLISILDIVDNWNRLTTWLHCSQLEMAITPLPVLWTLPSRLITTIPLRCVTKMDTKP